MQASQTYINEGITLTPCLQHSLSLVNFDHVTLSYHRTDIAIAIILVILTDVKICHLLLISGSGRPNI
jgi:hypothetical protein